MNNKASGSIGKNAIYNVIRRVCGVIFPLITFPYAARILQTDNYGIYTFSNSIIIYITLIAGLGIEKYATREGAKLREDSCKIRQFINEVFTINVVSTIGAFFILVMLLLCWRKLDAYRTVISILSINILFITLGTDWINVVFEDYAYITKRYIICQSASVLLLFLLVKSEGDVIWYAAVSIIGNIGSNLINIIYIRKKLSIYPHIIFDKNVLIHLTSVFVLFVNSIASKIYINSDVTILGAIQDDYAVGIYGVASKIYSLTKEVINAAILVIVPRVSNLIAKQDNEKIKKLLSKTVGSVLLLVIPAMVGLLCLSKEVVLLIAGSGYTEAYIPLNILSIALLFATLACFFIDGILLPYRKDKIILTLTCISAITNIGLNVILIPTYSYNAAAFTTLLSEVIMFIGGVVASRKIWKVPFIKNFIYGFSGGVIVLIASVFSKVIATHYLLVIVLDVLLSTILYFIFLMVVKNNIVYEEAMHFFRKYKKVR